MDELKNLIIETHMLKEELEDRIQSIFEPKEVILMVRSLAINIRRLIDLRLHPFENGIPETASQERIDHIKSRSEVEQEKAATVLGKLLGGVPPELRNELKNELKTVFNIDFEYREIGVKPEAAGAENRLH